MRKNLIFVLLILVSGTVSLTAQNDCSLIVAELNKMVDLNDNQKTKLLSLYSAYLDSLEVAIKNVSDREQSSLKIYQCKQFFNTSFMDMLSEKQKSEYVRAYAYPEVTEKAKAKVKILEKSGKYSEKELQKSFTEIYEYLMLEKIVYATQRYDIEKQKENIAQLKKSEPQSLRAANAYQKVKHQGVKYQDGFQW